MEMLSGTFLSSIVLAIGHTSFVLTFLSFAQKNLIRLRVITVTSLVLGLIYNGWINYHMAEGQNIRLVIFWLAMFILVNVYKLVQEIASNMEVRLSIEDRELLLRTFPAMYSRDWMAVMKCGKMKEFKKNDVLLSVGDPTSSLRIVVKGKATEIRSGVRKECGIGTLWGELTYVMGEFYYNESPVDIVVPGQKPVTGTAAAAFSERIG